MSRSRFTGSRSRSTEQLIQSGEIDCVLDRETGLFRALSRAVTHAWHVCLSLLVRIYMSVGIIFRVMSVCLSVWGCDINFWNIYLSYELYLYHQQMQTDYIFRLVCLWISVCLFGLHVINHLPGTSDIFTILRSSFSAKVTEWRSRSKKENLTSVLTKCVLWGLARRSRPSQGQGLKRSHNEKIFFVIYKCF